MAKVLEISHSGYNAWLVRKPSTRDTTDAALGVLIQEAHKASRKTYGPRRIKTELAEQGLKVGRDRIARVQKRKYKATTNSKHNLPTAPNLLHQQFANHRPGTAWGTDSAYIPTAEGWLYLAWVKDFGARRSWAGPSAIG